MTMTTTLAEVAISYPAAARVFYRHGLDFCCGGRRPMAEACAERGIDVQELMAEIAEAGPADAGPRWEQEPLGDLVAFIVAYYHQRLREAIPDLIRMAGRVEARHADKATCPAGLTRHLEAMHASVLEHLEKEEQVLFPMMLAGYGRRAVGPVHVMEREHDEHGRNLAMLRRLTGDLQPPPEACTTWRALYLGLQQLEQELMEHIHLENNVLFPRALAE